MTVTEFKKIVAAWPETNGRTGEPAEVWLETGQGLSSELDQIIPLNCAPDGTSDFLLCPKPEAWR